MSASQFDDLLGDFGDSSTTTTTTTKTSSNGAFDDDFDPFGPSSEAAPTSNGGDSGLLLDFSAGAEVQNGGSSNGVETQMTTSADPANPLYDMSADTQSSNPLYDLASGSSANPLYDLSSDADANQSANPLYEFSTETTSSSAAPTNPLYDFDVEGTNDNAQQEVDFLSGTNQQQEEGVPDQVDTAHTAPASGDLLGDFESSETAESQDIVNVEYEEPQIMNGNPKDWFGTQETEEQQQEEEEEDVEEEQLLDYSERVERVDEEEQVREDGRTVSKTTRTEDRYSGSGFETTQWEQERNQQNAGEQDIAHFSEMSSVKNKFESDAPTHPQKQFDYQQEVLSSEGGVFENEPQPSQQWQNEEEEEEGVYESQPQRRDDVAREADTDRTVDLPAVGTAQSLKAKFLAESQQASTPRSKREITPPVHGGGGEFVSEPRAQVEQYEGKPEAGVFESQPTEHNPEIITSDLALEDVTYERGYARSAAAKYKELANKGYTPTAIKELSPDRSGPVEYVSEPRGQIETYEGKPESGVFESQPQVNPDVVRSGEAVSEEPLPERGTAKNLANRFKQISESNTYSSPRGKKELTPDRSGQVEYVSEPRGKITEEYEVRVDAGVFENQPQRSADIVTSDSVPEEFVPEKGFAKNVAARFKEMECSAKSPPLSPGRRKEFTPPREDEHARTAGVLENTPQVRPDVIHSDDHLEEKLPERGTAKNIAQRYRQLEAENKSPTSPRQKKEFTPPPQGSGGVYENQPKQFQADYNRPAESGIIENTPLKRDDVIRADEPKQEAELPERGAAKNLVSKWRQLESESAKARSPGSGRPKEFTPPREEPRIAEQRKSPRTPMSPGGQGHDLDNGSVHPSELPGQYQPQNEPSVFESQPEQREDVLRETDTDWAAGMPKKDTAKKMLARFQNLQAEANKSAPPVARKDPADPKRRAPRKVGRSKSMRAAIQTEKCGACEKTVYAMERLEMNKRVYHKACFRCTQCRAVLTPKTFAINNDVIFCTTHYKQLFATKGNYDEGFGRMQHKKRWSSNPNLAAQDGENHGKQATVKS